MDSIRKFPIGQFVPKEHYTEEEVRFFIGELKAFPSKLRAYMEKVPDTSWDTPYRRDGWTVRQVIHHLADSHSIMYFRVKQTITNEKPSVPGYPEHLWAELPDSTLSPWVSISLLDALHERLVYILENMPYTFWQNRPYFHTGYETWYPLERVIALYQWHGEHHLGHIRLAVENPETV